MEEREECRERMKTEYVKKWEMAEEKGENIKKDIWKNEKNERTESEMKQI